LGSVVVGDAMAATSCCLKIKKAETIGANSEQARLLTKNLKKVSLILHVEPG
jgi:hypothetical protein